MATIRHWDYRGQAACDPSDCPPKKRKRNITLLRGAVNCRKCKAKMTSAAVNNQDSKIQARKGQWSGRARRDRVALRDAAIVHCSGKFTQQEIARLFNISQAMVSKVIKRDTSAIKDRDGFTYSARLV